MEPTVCSGLGISERLCLGACVLLEMLVGGTKTGLEDGRGASRGVGGCKFLTLCRPERKGRGEEGERFTRRCGVQKQPFIIFICLSV